MIRFALVVLATLVLASLAPIPASAGGGGRHLIGVWEPVRGWSYVGRRWLCNCGPRPGGIQNSLAQDYSASYYQSRGGIGRGYWTTVYSTDGYFHRYRR